MKEPIFHTNESAETPQAQFLFFKKKTKTISRNYIKALSVP